MLAALRTLPLLRPEINRALATELDHMYASNLFQTACYALYCYDHLLVFSDEVEKIWKKPFTLPSLLYILQRYLTHAGFILIQLALHERGWAADVCARFVQVPGAFIILSFALTAATLILRMHAMYWKNNILLFCLSLVLIGQIVIMGVCISTGTRHPFVDGCIFTSPASYFGAFWAAPLGMDAIVLALALYRVYNYRQFRIRSTLAEQLLRDGVPYVFGVFGAKLLCVVAFVTAPDDLRELGASFALAFSLLLVARLQLSLDNREPEAENIHRLFFTADQEGSEDGNASVRSGAALARSARSGAPERQSYPPSLEQPVTALACAGRFWVLPEKSICSVSQRCTPISECTGVANHIQGAFKERYSENQTDIRVLE